MLAYGKKTIITDGTNDVDVITANGQMGAVVITPGHVSTDNSTSTPLAGDATFTGTSEGTVNHGTIVLSVYSDVGSATNGLVIEFSTDNVNWDNKDEYTILAGVPESYTIQTAAEYMRVRYINGSSAQSVFRLQTILKPYYVKPSSHRVGDAISAEDDAELVKAVITGLAPDGTFKNVLVTNAGNQKVSLEERDPTLILDDKLEIARGNVTGVAGVNKFGLATNGVQTSATDIWDRADAATTQQIWLAPTAARIHQVTSTSTADDGTPEGAGAGAQAVRIWGLQTWASAETSEDVILNGTANVATANSYVIIHRMKVMPVGSTYNNNVGTITATADTDSTVTAQINIGKGQTNMAIYGLPSTQTAYVTGWDVNAHLSGSVATAVEVDFSMLVNERPDLNTLVWLNKANTGTVSTGDTSDVRDYNPYKPIPGPAIIKFQAISSELDTEASAEFDLELVTN